jgi:site-specific recombinase XerD
MTEEVTIFNKINELSDFNYSGAQIASWSGLEKSLISRFLNGKSDAGIPLRHIQEISGHNDLGTLQRYLEVSPDQRRKAVSVIGF